MNIVIHDKLFAGKHRRQLLAVTCYLNVRDISKGEGYCIGLSVLIFKPYKCCRVRGSEVNALASTLTMKPLAKTGTIYFAVCEPFQCQRVKSVNFAVNCRVCWWIIVLISLPMYPRYYITLFAKKLNNSSFGWSFALKTFLLLRMGLKYVWVIAKMSIYQRLGYQRLKINNALQVFSSNLELFQRNVMWQLATLKW